MRLKNKKTGEIVDTLCRDDITKGLAFGVDRHDGNPTMVYYNSLAELNADWEDVPEEPKGYWFIDSLGEVHKHTKDSRMLDIEQTAIEDWHLNIGNHFDTEEEAEKDVEKLKAWKRLKNNGLRFEGIKEDYTRILQSQAPFRTGKRYLQFNKSEDEDWIKENWEDLVLLFGGEE